MVSIKTKAGTTGSRTCRAWQYQHRRQVNRAKKHFICNEHRRKGKYHSLSRRSRSNRTSTNCTRTSHGTICGRLWKKAETEARNGYEELRTKQQENMNSRTRREQNVEAFRTVKGDSKVKRHQAHCRLFASTMVAETATEPVIVKLEGDMLNVHCSAVQLCAMFHQEAKRHRCDVTLFCQHC